jgi:Lectin C-type domain
MFCHFYCFNFWIIVPLTSALGWEEARQQCLLQSSDLAEMNTLEEQEIFVKYLNSWREYSFNYFIKHCRSQKKMLSVSNYNSSIPLSC